jgi:hypothetical protein
MNARLLALPLSLALCASCDSGDGAMVGGDGNFDTLTLSSSGGMPGPRNDGDECNTTYTNRETVTSSPATIVWDLCAWPTPDVQHTVIAQGSRELTAAELATVNEALLHVHVGKSDLCGYDKPVVILDVQAHGGVGHYVDDFYGCKPAPDGRTFVTGMDWIESAVGKLVP